MTSAENIAVASRHRASAGLAPLAQPGGATVGADFFARSADTVAHELVGKILWREGVGGGRLTEVEAYLPSDDPACHAFHGLTARNRSMFGPPGSIYVYLSYGIHVLLNLVCGQEGVGTAVLVRSFEPLGDTRRLWANRLGSSRSTSPKSEISLQAKEPAQPAVFLSRGPGRVGQALGLYLDFDGLALGSESGLWVIDDGRSCRVCADTRIGISRGRQLPLRFYAADSRFVSHRRTRDGGARDETP